MSTYMSPGVYIKEEEAGSRPIEGVGTAVAAFVGFAERGPANSPTLVTNWGQYQATFGDFVAGTFLPLAVYQYFDNGGGAAYVVRIGADDSASANGPSEPVATAELASAAIAGTTTYEISARQVDDAGGTLSVEVIHDPADGDEAPETFSIVVREDGTERERHDGLSTRKGSTNVATVVNAASALITIDDVSSLTLAEKLPALGTVELAAPTAAAMMPDAVTSDDLIGDAADRSALGGLDAIDEVTMVAVPDLMALYKQGVLDLEGVKAVQLGIIGHCERMGDRMAILDPPPGLNAQEILDWRVDFAGYDSKFATLYWPWVKVVDPGAGRTDFVPPSGAIAGLWGRTDDARGVHKAPANDVVRGALDVHINITKNEHDLLNPKGINVIRSFPGRGIRVWGARTLSSDPAWRYLNVRRLFNYVEQSILDGTQWAVFEPNDMDLWQRISRTIRGFLLTQWREGALFGATPDEAFYVKCDEETNPPELVDNGQVTVEIGIAPVRPAEFVVFKVAQLSSGGGVSE
ncbi:MAG: phage tail sheath subtilisin-like domain-containing protein [Actinomycetota bacterium]